MVYNGYYKVMSNIPKMGHLPTPVHDPKLQNAVRGFVWRLTHQRNQLRRRKRWFVGTRFTEMPWIFWNHLRWRSKMKCWAGRDDIWYLRWFNLAQSIYTTYIFIEIYLYTWNAVVAYFFRLLWASSQFLWKCPILMEKIAYFEVLGRCLHFEVMIN